MKIFIKLSTIIIFLAIGLTGIAQTPDKPTVVQGNKKQLSIRPNSRDYGVTLRNNSFQRIDRPRKLEFIHRMKPNRPHKGLKKGINQSRRQELIQQRKMMLRQRRAINR